MDSERTACLTYVKHAAQTRRAGRPFSKLYNNVSNPAKSGHKRPGEASAMKPSTRARIFQTDNVIWADFRQLDAEPELGAIAVRFAVGFAAGQFWRSPSCWSENKVLEIGAKHREQR